DATLLGSSTPERRVDIGLAALVNGALVRDLDANDIFAGPPGRDTGHFSDAIPAVLAAAERTGASGAEFLTAIVVAYEVQAALATAYCWMNRGLHSVSQLAWAVPAAVGRLFGLTHDEVVSAIGLAGTTGGLTLNSWLKPGTSMPFIKGGAPGLIGKLALEATELAALGFTAPPDALETLFDRLPADADPTPFERLGEPGHFTITRNMLKRYPAQIYTQSAIEAAVTLHPEIESDDDIAVATVYGHRGVAAGVQGSGAAYTPATRAAADHSTPFVVATALRDGDVSPVSYDGEPWLDPRMIDLMRRVDLVIDPEFENGLTEHGRFGCRLVVELLDGRRLEATVAQQHGHPDNPLSRDELLAKMRGLADRTMGQGTAERLLAAVEDLPRAPNLDRLLEACRARR
ncbi:MAG TPA: MmgE/PrpD family protein, partial [Thermomicrobiaceae bacterium]|nr:MmgE/PrpD family protein [Thermomicrobiaceae bacterium]